MTPVKEQSKATGLVSLALQIHQLQNKIQINAPRPPIRWGASKVNPDLLMKDLWEMMTRNVNGASVCSNMSTNICGDVR